MFRVAKAGGAWLEASRCLSISLVRARSLIRSSLRTRCSTCRRPRADTLAKSRKARGGKPLPYGPAARGDGVPRFLDAPRTSGTGRERLAQLRADGGGALRSGWQTPDARCWAV